MKKTLMKFVGTGFLAFALTVVAFEQQAAAQIDDPSPIVTQTDDDDDDDFDWGLLGLLGLLGLGGLMRRDNHHTVHRDTVVPAGTHTNRT